MLKIEIGRCLLQNLLDKRGMTRQQLSDLTGVSVSQISDYIYGTRKPNIRNAKLLAIGINCSIDDLFEWKIKR